MMLKKMFWSLLLICLVGDIHLINAQEKFPEKPNIVLFLADNWSWPHASQLGDPVVSTPVFDRIAREGVLFKYAFCPVPSCSPTRSCLLTGRPAHQLKDAASLWSAFPQGLQTFTELLTAAGYETGYSGKGWGPGNHVDFGRSENPVGKRYRDFQQFMQQRDTSKPFFFWVGNTDTSLNKWRFKPEEQSNLKVDALRIPAYLPDVKEVRESMLGYYAGITKIDEDAGRTVEVLEQAKIFDETLFIYTSDNGWQMPRGLANCYDTGTRVPFAVRWGKYLNAGTMNDFISLTDLAPTFLEIAGLEIPKQMTGKSLVPLLKGESSLKRDHVFLERERHANVRAGDLSYPVRGIRTWDYLFLWNLRPERWPAGDPQVYFAVGDFGDVDNSPAKMFLLEHKNDANYKSFFDLSFDKRPEFELYDLNKDADQMHNVAQQSEYLAIQKELLARVKDWMKNTEDPRIDPHNDDWDKFKYYGGPAKSIYGKDR